MVEVVSLMGGVSDSLQTCEWRPRVANEIFHVLSFEKMNHCEKVKKLLANMDLMQVSVEA